MLKDPFPDTSMSIDVHLALSPRHSTTPGLSLVTTPTKEMGMVAIGWAQLEFGVLLDLFLVFLKARIFV